MRIFSKLAASLALLVALVALAPPAAAQTCAPTQRYCSQDTPDEGEVLPETEERTSSTTEVPTGGPLVVERPDEVEDEVQSNALPITGGDVIGLTIIGAVAVGLGTIIVVRSKKSAPAEA